MTSDAAYDLQRQHADAIVTRFGGEVIGSKLAGGDLASMHALGLNGPFRGPIFSAFTQPSPARWPRDDFFVCLIEAEIAFLIGRDLGNSAEPPPSMQTIRDSIDAVIPCIEIADARFDGFAKAPPAAVLADLAYAGAWVRGRQVEDWQYLDLGKLDVRLRVNGAEMRRGVGTRSFGDPLEALLACVADLRLRGETLKAGTIVSAGTFTAPYPASAGDLVVADFGDLGSVELSLDG